MFAIKFKGHDRYSTIENIFILVIIIGTVLLVSGIGLSIVSPKGIPAAIAMLGSFLIFVFSVLLILMWFFFEKS